MELLILNIMEMMMIIGADDNKIIDDDEIYDDINSHDEIYHDINSHDGCY